MVLHIEKLRSAYSANSQFSTSSKVGTDGAAPGLDTAIADALDARSVPLLGFALADGGYEETSKSIACSCGIYCFYFIALLWDHLVFVNINRTLRA